MLSCKACGVRGNFQNNGVCNQCKNGRWFKIESEDVRLYRYSITETSRLTIRDYFRKYNVFDEDIIDNLLVELVAKNFQNLPNNQQLSLNDRISRLSKGVCLVHDPLEEQEEDEGLWFNLCTDSRTETARLNLWNEENENTFGVDRNMPFIVESDCFYISESEKNMTIQEYLVNNNLASPTETWEKLELAVFADGWYDLIDGMVDDGTYSLSNNGQR